MTAKLKVEATVHFGRGSRSKKVAQAGEAPPDPPGRVPRISRMMALAIWFDELIRRGEVKNFAELAKLGQVSRTQVTHVMNLLLLAPTIQEKILFLPRVTSIDPIPLRLLQNLCQMKEWRKQQERWRTLELRLCAPLGPPKQH